MLLSGGARAGQATALTEQAAAAASQDADDTLEQLYRQAMAIRSKRNPTWREQQKAVEEMLVTAAGVRPVDPNSPYSLPPHQPSGSAAGSSTAAAGEHRGHSTPVPNFPELEIGPHAHPGALRELAKALMDGFGCDPDAQLALALFKHAAQLGDPEAQGQMGLRYSLGLQYHTSWSRDGVVHFGEPDQDEAVLHHYFAASGGDSLSRMALGYMHLTGSGAPKSCFSAASYYLPVAEKVADMASDPHGPGLPQVERIRLHVHFLHGSRAGRQKEVVQYYQDSADKGNVDAQTAVGQVLNYGTHGVERDHEAAMSYLQRAADAGDVQAMAHLGNMMANGLGGTPDYTAAFKHFEAAARQNNAQAQYGLGYMYLVGQGVAQDMEKAFKLFSQAADQGHSDAYFFLGVMHLRGLGARRKSIQRAFTYFTAAAQAGNVHAMYQAAMLHLGGKGTTRSCKPAVSLLKLASERGPVGAVLQQAHEAYFRGQHQRALWGYLQAGAAGMELGMSNAAWLLTQGYVRAGGEVQNVTFALHQRSAAQGNVASLLAMGDAYFYGQGVQQDWARASAIYYEAYQERSPEAMFNLGFMHEFGAGVPKDLQLASRFYDMSLHTSSEAALAIYCARTWLLLHRAWEALRPLLPTKYEQLWHGVWQLTPPHTSVLGSWTALAASLLPSQAVLQLEIGAWRWLDATGLASLLSAVSDRKDLGETGVMLLLTLLLLLVLRLRRQRVAQYQQAVGGAGRAAPAPRPAAAVAAGVAAGAGDGDGAVGTQRAPPATWGAVGVGAEAAAVGGSTAAGPGEGSSSGQHGDPARAGQEGNTDGVGMQGGTEGGSTQATGHDS